MLLKDFFMQHDDDTHKGAAHKNVLIKRNIIAHMAMRGASTLADLANELHVSIPTMTKLVAELAAENIVVDNGKMDTAGGRRPSLFGLASSAIYFAGVEISRDAVHYVITDLQNNVIVTRTDEDFTLTDDNRCLNLICQDINAFLDGCGIERGKILGMGVCIVGRINPKTGNSYRYFTDNSASLRDILEEKIGMRILLENDTRAICYAEYFGGNPLVESNVLYLNLGRGFAIGIIADGKLYYGKSGFAGEFGHTPFFNNDVLCVCGKKGCLETEISGIALEGKMTREIEKGVDTSLREKYESGQSIHIDDIIGAAKSDDTLSIELIEEAGKKIGKSIAFLINIFNPELVIIGGNMSGANDYLMLPLKAAVNKYSVGLVYKDTAFRFSTLGRDAGARGAAMLIRNEIIGV